MKPVTLLCILFIYATSLSPHEGRAISKEVKEQINLEIEKFPLYIPKVEENRDCGMEFFIKIKLSNVAKDEKWKIKIWVSADPSHRRAATQTWDGSTWKYSYYYTFTSKGNWSEWIRLRFCRRYKEYGSVWNSSKCFILAKCVVGKQSITTSRTVFLLDMDNSSSCGVPGGLIIGKVENFNGFFLLVDACGKTISVGKVRLDYRVGIKGFYKTYAPIGVRLRMIGENGKVIKNNIWARRGTFNLNAWVKDNKLWIKNTGDFPERINVVFDKPLTVFLLPGEIIDIDVPRTFNKEIYLFVEEDPNVSKKVKLPYEKERLSVEWIRFDGVDGFDLERGKIYKLKAKIRVYGKIENVSVLFYLNGLKVGQKVYRKIHGYYVYPSVYIDTSRLREANSIEVEVRCGNDSIKERISFCVKSDVRIGLLIVKVLCREFEWFGGEFIEIFNPNNYSVDISGWYLTDEPTRRVDKQSKLIFPEGSIIRSNESIVITSNASSFKAFFDRYPDFVYGNKREIVGIEEMIERGRVKLNNFADVLVLKDRFNRTVDVMVYGEDVKLEGWKGKGIASCDRGRYYERKKVNNRYTDTNSSTDWLIKVLGGTNLEQVNFSGEMELMIFPSADYSSYRVLKEFAKAEKSIMISSFSLFDKSVEEYLKEVAKRGVKIKILVSVFADREITNPFVDCANIEVYAMGLRGSYRLYKHYYASYAVVDNQTLIFGDIGSDHGDREGERGRGWIVVVKNSELAKYFYKIFKTDLSLPDVASLECYEHEKGEGSITLDDTLLFQPLHIVSNVTISPLISPDNCEDAFAGLVRRAEKSIYIETRSFNPYEAKRVCREVINASKRGVDVRIIMNPKHLNEDVRRSVITLRDYGINVKLIDPFAETGDIYTWMIIDNSTVAISSVDLDEISTSMDRGVGLIIYSKEISRYFTKAFVHDWCGGGTSREDYKSSICLSLFLLGLTLLIVKRWRKK